MTKKDTYQDTSNEQLSKLLSEKREELRVLRFSAAGSRPKDSSEPARLRKEVARIMTEFSTRSVKGHQLKVTNNSGANTPSEEGSDTTN